MLLTASTIQQAVGSSAATAQLWAKPLSDACALYPRAHGRGHVLRERRGAGREEPGGAVHPAHGRADAGGLPVVALGGPGRQEPDLLSFAAITDDPEPEVAAAGHDRTIINIKPEHVDAWLNPDPADLAALYRIFDDKRHPFYEHQLAA